MTAYDYKTAAVETDARGVVTVRLHSRGGPLVWARCRTGSWPSCSPGSAVIPTSGPW